MVRLLNGLEVKMEAERQNWSAYQLSERQTSSNGPSPGLILATGSSAFLASLLINMAAINIQASDQVTTITTMTTSMVTTPTTSTQSSSSTTSTPFSNIPNTGCPDGWVDGRSVQLGCLLVEIREEPLLIGEDYYGNDMAYSLGGGEGVN